METVLIEKKFSSIGARVKINDSISAHPHWRRQSSDTITINIFKDKEGEYFDIKMDQNAKALVMDAQKKDRHLLLMARDLEGKPSTETSGSYPSGICGRNQKKGSSQTTSQNRRWQQNYPPR